MCGEKSGRVEEKTQLISAKEPGAVKKVAAFVRQGELVVLPTDTVYGVGCAADNETAIARLYRVKQRPFSKAIPILLADLSHLPAVTAFIPPVAEALIQQYWPGPLTLILPKHPNLPAVLSPNQGVAVRIPDHTLTRTVIRAAGGAMAVTSANQSGEPAAETAVQAFQTLAGQVTVVLDDGPSPRGQASTIISCMGNKLKIIRSGPIHPAEIRRFREAQVAV